MQDTPIAMITGASRGLGFALADALARRGWRLVIDGRDAAALDTAAAQLRAAGAAEVAAVGGDVADATHRDALVTVVAGRGPVTALVNNASTLGATPLPRLRDYPLDALAETFRVNTIAPLALVQAALAERYLWHEFGDVHLLLP